MWYSEKKSRTVTIMKTLVVPRLGKHCQGCSGVQWIRRQSIQNSQGSTHYYMLPQTYKMYTTEWASCNLWTVGEIVCQVGSSVANVPLRDIGKGGTVFGGKGYVGAFCLSQFCCQPKTALKNKVFKMFTVTWLQLHDMEGVRHVKWMKLASLEDRGEDLWLE
jgi:hypothetical protein